MSEPSSRLSSDASKTASDGSGKGGSDPGPARQTGDIHIGRVDPSIYKTGDVVGAVAAALKLDPATVIAMGGHTGGQGGARTAALEVSPDPSPDTLPDSFGDSSSDGRHAVLIPFSVGQVAWRVESVIGRSLDLPTALRGLARTLNTRIAHDSQAHASQTHDSLAPERHDAKGDGRVDVYFPDGTVQEGLLHYHDEVEGLENYKFDMNVRPTLLDKIGALIAGRITAQSSGYDPYTPSDPDSLLAALEPGDVLLVEGNQKVSAAIKYLTQSTWSHAALYVGDALPQHGNAPRDRLIEVNLGEGCVARPLEKYRTYNTRICRPVGLTKAERRRVVEYMITRLGTAYDTRNIIDMARYLVPVIPVPTRWRRKMIAFGSGDPTRAICSTLIAQAFQSIRYPILPSIKRLEDCLDDDCEAYAVGEVYHIRHHSLFAPRDFDVSPFFKIVKPTLSTHFNFRDILWHDDGEEGGQEVAQAQDADDATTETTEATDEPPRSPEETPAATAATVPTGN